MISTHEMFLAPIFNRALVQTVEQRIHPSLEQYYPSPMMVPPTMLNALGKQKLDIFRLFIYLPMKVYT